MLLAEGLRQLTSSFRPSPALCRTLPSNAGIAPSMLQSSSKTARPSSRGAGTRLTTLPRMEQNRRPSKHDRQRSRCVVCAHQVDRLIETDGLYIA